MAFIALSYVRIEPQPDEVSLQAGIAAAVNDPVWFLARQWQMGEFQGENASSPVWVEYDLKQAQIDSYDSRFDPAKLPAEAIVESELNDWWTMGRRIRIGRALADQAGPAGIDADLLRFVDPPPPYEQFGGEIDGLALWLKLIEAGVDPSVLVPGVPPDSIPAWNSRQLLYQQDQENAFRSGEVDLVVTRHHGGRLDWHSVDAHDTDAAMESAVETREAIPAALQYPGAPNTRWWQIENAEVDAGFYVPDSAHTPTAFLTELIYSHSDDWFLFPVLGKAGTRIAIESVDVKDGFDRHYRSIDRLPDGELAWLGLQSPENWSLFRVDGLDPEELLLWNVAETPLESLPIERVQFGPDEESNLVWAVERVVAGREVGHTEPEETAQPLPPAFNEGKPSGDTSKQREYAYVPARGIAQFWHPYLIDEDASVRMLVQHRLPDLTRQRPLPMPPPRAEMLQAATGEEHHTIAPLAIPSNGIELERRWNLARDIHGHPVLWIERRRKPSLSPPGRRLRFDVMEEALE
jgi:hypothetical protein